jgi:hypothetical protein
MLLQTNSYIVPPDKRAEHARLMRRFRQALHKVGCDNFEVYEQVGANWGGTTTTGRFVQIMRFRDRRHQLAVQNAERNDAAAQQLIAEFCELINYPFQQQQQQFVVGFYSSALPVAPALQPQQSTDAPADADPETAEVTLDHPAAPDAAQPAHPGDELHAVELEDSSEKPVEATSAPQASDEALAEEAVLEETIPGEPAAEETTTEDALQVAGNEEPDDFFEHPTSPESAEDVLESAGETPMEGAFADDSEAFAAETEEALPDEPAAESAPHDELSETADGDAESGFAIDDDDDDISRLAEELTGDDEELSDPRNPDSNLHGRGRASGNGAH